MKLLNKILLFALFGMNTSSLFSQQFQDAVMPKQNINRSSTVSAGMDLSTGTVSPSIVLAP